jgi:predicted phosphodiesterase
LEEIAPVIVVQGNRDWLFGMSFPLHVNLTINSVRTTLTHGHRSMLQYLFDKWSYIRIGYRFERYYRHLSADYPNSDVIIFGHTHYQTATWVNGQLFFNPGAAYPCQHNHNQPQFGILSITPGGIIRTECY